MIESQRPIFRERARRFYWQRYQPDVLPRFISPTLFLVGWFLVALLLGVLVLFLSVLSGFLRG